MTRDEMNGRGGGAAAAPAATPYADLPRRRPHGRLWHAANVVGALLVAAIAIVSLQVHRPGSGIQVTAARSGAGAIPPGMLVQVRRAGNVEIIAGHRLPQSGRLTLRLPPGRYVVEVRSNPGVPAKARRVIRVSTNTVVSAPLRLGSGLSRGRHTHARASSG